MAYIAQRGEFWRAEVRRRGHKPTYRTFDTKQQAQQWARRIESEIDCGAFVDRTAAERTTLREALLRYQKEVIPQKRYPQQENYRVARWLKHDLAHKTLANLRGADFAADRELRRAAGRAENRQQRGSSNPPLSTRAVDVIRHLAAIAEGERRFHDYRTNFGPLNVDTRALTGPVFVTTTNVIVCVWKRALAKAAKCIPAIKELRWHDLRHEAASRLFEKGLHPIEAASISGHKSMQMLKRYTHLKPESLLAKLG